jgi:hypothetical protein
VPQHPQHRRVSIGLKATDGADSTVMTQEVRVANSSGALVLLCLGNKRNCKQRKNKYITKLYPSAYILSSCKELPASRVVVEIKIILKNNDNFDYTL